MTNILKKICILMMGICLIFGLLPASAFATDTNHTHSWSSTWTASDSHHWHECTSDGCSITTESECSEYGAHDFSTYPYRCTICHFGAAHEHYGGTATCEYSATCKGCGTVYGETNPNNHQFPNGFAEKIDGSSHKIMCSCGHIFVASESHNFTPWDKNSDGSEERWCEDCRYAETRTSQHTHTYSEATCSAPATCSCGSTTGAKNPNNHTGTEIRNAVAATYDVEGYSGDTYCKGCGVMIAKGKSVAKLASFSVELGSDTYIERFTFKPAEGTFVPVDATLSAEVLANHYGASQLRSALSNHLPDIHITNTDAKIRDLMNTAYQDPNGDIYRFGEVVLIDNKKYCIARYDGSGTILPVIGMSDGVMRSYNMEGKQFASENDGEFSIDNTANRKLCQDGIMYDVSFSYTDQQGNEQMILSYDGQLAGIHNTDGLHLYDGFTPEALMKQDQSYFGTLRLSEDFADSGLTPGKDYRIEFISARDIQLLSKDGSPLFTNEDGSGKEIGTLYHEFSYTAPTGAISLGFHLADDGEIDFGTVTPVEDSDLSLITFPVDHFSPFIICTFTEVDEPKIKSITSSISNVGSVDNSNETRKDDGHVWIWLASVVFLAVGASLAVVFLVRKRKK